MMNRRGFSAKAMVLGLTLCLALGGVASAMAEETTASTASFEAIAEKMADADSMTLDAQIAIRQNGEDVITGDVLCQLAEDSQYTSATITRVGGETADMEQSISGGTRTVRMGDDFYSMPDDGEDMLDDAEDMTESERGMMPEDTSAYLNTVIEQLFGSMTQKMTVTDDGISLHVSGDEVPAILNLAMSMMDGYQVTDDAQTLLYGTRGEAAEATPEHLSLGTNLRIASIDLDVAMADDFLSGIQFSIVISGVDADGAAIETELAAVVRVTDVNATTPAAVDVTGVDMQPVKTFHRNYRNFR